MNPYLLVFIGGGLGSAARLGIGTLMNRYVNSIFPYGTLCVNVISSFILGLLTASLLFKLHAQSEQQRLLIGVGFCGGLSTFSTFSLELFSLLKTQNYFLAGVNVLASVAACLLAVWLGMILVKN